jgi:hypothetical protein
MVADMVANILTELALAAFYNPTEDKRKQYPLIKIAKPFPETFSRVGIWAYQYPPGRQNFHGPAAVFQAAGQQVGEPQHAFLPVRRIVAD